MTEPTKPPCGRHVRPKVRSSKSNTSTDNEAHDRQSLHPKGASHNGMSATTSRQEANNTDKSDTAKTSTATASQTEKDTKSSHDVDDKDRSLTRSPLEEACVTTPPRSILSRQPKYSCLEKKTKRLVPTTMVKDLVVERPNVKSSIAPNIHTTSHVSIEGYNAKTTTSSNALQRKSNPTRANNTSDSSSTPILETPKEAQNDEPLILSSMAELLSLSQQSNPTESHNKSSNAPNQIETNLSFSVMSPKEYQQALQQEKEEPQEEQEQSNLYNVFYGRNQQLDVQEDFSTEETIGVQDNNDETRQNNEDDEAIFLLEQLMAQEEEEEEPLLEDALPAREPRAFLKIWMALSHWMTPQATEWICKAHALPEVPPMLDRTDIGASRCAGLQSILKLHLSKVYKELNLVPQRQVELQLSNLLRCFSYEQPNPNLGTVLWRTMTAVLVTIAMTITPQQQDSTSIILPTCAKEVGMTLEEYRYLCQSALTSLGCNS